MLENSTAFLTELAASFRLVDAIDILLVASLLYAGLLWFRRTASREAFSGIGLLAVVYFTARGLDMYLTSLVFQTTFAILLFALVVVFQEDLRRLFERVSSLRSVRLRAAGESAVDVDSLVEAVFRLADEKTGALIVLKGSEPLYRHVDGGVPLDGRVSKPLLYSLFDSSTPGHDGAAILEKDRIEQFAAHLPISKNTGQIAGRGTRHCAGLGISECSDALAIVASEERGVVSVAEAGVIKETQAPADLKRRIDKFLKTTHPEPTQPLWDRLLVRHASLKLLAVSIASVAWLVLAYDPDVVQRTFVVPVEYRNLSKRMELDDAAANEARVTLSGSERDFRFLDPANLTVSIDLADYPDGLHFVTITDRHVRLPANLSSYRFEPRSLSLILRQKQPETPPSDEKKADSAADPVSGDRRYEQGGESQE